MTIHIPKPLAVIGGLGLAAFLAYFVYEEVPAMRRYLKYEMM